MDIKDLVKSIYSTTHPELYVINVVGHNARCTVHKVKAFW